jgi:hypothetical protein
MSYIAGTSLEDMTKYPALWYVATTLLLIESTKRIGAAEAQPIPTQ